MKMEKYEFVSVVGEGAYGKVMKCKHRETGQMVAIKRFLETEEDKLVRKMALREIRVLKKLKHDNLVWMIEVFRRRKRFYLVFEFVCKTLLDELEEYGYLSEEKTKKYTFQILRGLDFIHENNIVHRDVKPENVLVTKSGVIKLCDFGFARFVTSSGEPYTDYVATRWYRAPELLVGDPNYGRPVDIWATGCIILEMLNGDPLFAGNSDLDQIYCIISLLGDLTDEQMLQARKVMSPVPLSCAKKQNNDYVNKGVEYARLKFAFPNLNRLLLEFVACCLTIDPASRLTAPVLLDHKYFQRDNFAQTFLAELQSLAQKESAENLLVTKQSNTLKNQITYGPHKKSGKTPEWHIDIVDGLKESSTNNQLSQASDEIVQKKILRKEQAKSLSTFKNLTRMALGKEEASGKSIFDGISKIPMPYKKDIVPNTQTIRLIRGHLVTDKHLNIPYHSFQPRRYICEDLSLPDIQRGKKHNCE